MESGELGTDSESKFTGRAVRNVAGIPKAARRGELARYRLGTYTII
ncbi:MAG: hypothetical protein PHH85_04860 [Candidatus Methanoperedens sp.]|nr:hypothetical protein [Candidatus Methanoperedens sp.]